MEKKSIPTNNVDNETLDKITRIYTGKLLQNYEFLPFKKGILKTRKEFVKLYKNKALEEVKVIKVFKGFLESKLNFKISDKLFYDENYKN